MNFKKKCGQISHRQIFWYHLPTLRLKKKIGMQVMRGNTEGMRKREGKKVGMVNYNRTSLYTH